jgi:hypothetical protein
MRSYAAILAVALAIPASAAAQAPVAPARAGAEAQASPPPPAPPVPDASSSELARIKRRLHTETPIRDTAEQMPVTPTFRTSVTQRIDIWKFWGEPDEVAAYVRPRGGTWHQEFQAMVTPEEFRNGAGLGSGEQLQLAATGLAFAGAMKLLTMGVQQVKQAAHDRTTRKAKEEVQRELAEFCAATPGACASTPP